jgi:carbonic anhydrase/acetyltransferase-like protein (isoleucine patch superfamily)
MEEIFLERLKKTRLLQQLFIWRGNLRAIGRKRRALGRHAYVPRSVQVLGWEHVRIGDYSLLCEGTCVNINHPKLSVRIGSHCYIGRRNFISPGDMIQFGDYCLTTADCHFLGADHDYGDPFTPYLASPATPEGRIMIGTNCWFGCGSTVLKNVEIGFGSIIGARALVKSSIPPFSMAVGNPARVVRRFDPLASRWIPAAQFTGAMEQALPKEEAYLAGLRRKHPELRGSLRTTCSSFGDF